MIIKRGRVERGLLFPIHLMSITVTIILSYIESVNRGYFAVGLNMFSACFASACRVHLRGSREGGRFYRCYHSSMDL